jgi:hypothetical protein
VGQVLPFQTQVEIAWGEYRRLVQECRKRPSLLNDPAHLAARNAAHRKYLEEFCR